MGYAYVRQTTAGIHLRTYARAFIFEEGHIHTTSVIFCGFVDPLPPLTATVMQLIGTIIYIWGPLSLQSSYLHAPCQDADEAAEKKRVAFVSADMGMLGHLIKGRVLQDLQALFPGKQTCH